jgi:hypothetical protein
MFVSYEMKFDHADKRFPKFFEQIMKIHNMRKGRDLFESDISYGLDRHMVIKFRPGACEMLAEESDLRCYDARQLVAVSRRDANGRLDGIKLRIHELPRGGYDDPRTKALLANGLIFSSMSTSLELDIDIDNPDDKVLIRRVYMAPAEIEFNSGNFASTLDLTDPTDPVNTLMELIYSSDPHFPSPSLKEITLHLSQRVTDMLVVDGDLLKPERPFIAGQAHFLGSLKEIFNRP